MAARAYSFLAVAGYSELPNEYHLPVFRVRRQGESDYENQPAGSIEDAVSHFAKYTNAKTGTVIEALLPGQDPLRHTPYAYRVTGGRIHGIR